MTWREQGRGRGRAHIALSQIEAALVKSFIVIRMRGRLGEQGVHGGLVHYISSAIERTNVACLRRDLASSARRGGPCERGQPRVARCAAPRPWPCFINRSLYALAQSLRREFSDVSISLDEAHNHRASAATRPADKRGGIIRISPRQTPNPPHSSRELCH